MTLGERGGRLESIGLELDVEMALEGEEGVRERAGSGDGVGRVRRALGGIWNELEVG